MITLTALPTEPGTYYWSEWKQNVEIVRRGRTLYVQVKPEWEGD